MKLLTAILKPLTAASVLLVLALLCFVGTGLMARLFWEAFLIGWRTL